MKNTYRFFVDPEALRADEVHLVDQSLAHQLGRVLRLSRGARVLLLDGLGTSCDVELVAIERDSVRGRVVARGEALGEPPVTLTVFLPLIRPERFEWALQKCVELGAVRLVPVAFARSLPADRADPRKLERWRRIVREAAEQSCRGCLPVVAESLPFATACAEAAASELALILWEREAVPLGAIIRARSASGALRSVAVLSGPEGGIDDQELKAAEACGIMPVSLGPRILRAETAPMAAAAIVIATLEAPGA